MPGCSCGGDIKFDGISEQYKKILKIVIGINVLMFVVEMFGSYISGSMALGADALDFFGDSLTYSITLLAIGHSLIWRARAAIFKGITLAALGIWVIGSTIYRIYVTGIPNEFIMGYVALAAFAANVGSALLLMKYRDGDANVRSVWLCSRNDAIGNLSVIVAALAVAWTNSYWPDLMVAFLIASLFLHSAYLILKQAIEEKKKAEKLNGIAVRCNVSMNSDDNKKLISNISIK